MLWIILYTISKLIFTDKYLLYNIKKQNHSNLSKDCIIIFNLNKLVNSKTDFRPFSKMFNIQFIQYIEIASDYINLRSTSHSDFNQAIKEISSQKWSPPILDLNWLGYIYVNGMYIYIYMYICIYSLSNFNLILHTIIIIIYTYFYFLLEQKFLIFY